MDWWKKVNPAYSCFLWAALSLLDYAGLTARFAGEMMEIQFLVVHSSAFIFWVPAITRPTARKAAFACLATVYITASLLVGGIVGVLQFAVFTYSTYYGYVFHGGAAGREPVLLRWGVSGVLFIVVMAVGGAPSDVESWAVTEKMALVASVYYACLGAVELSGFYERAWPAIKEWFKNLPRGEE